MCADCEFDGEFDEGFDEDDERDWHQEFKDDVAMGLRDSDGNWLDQPEPDDLDYYERPAGDYDAPDEPPDDDPWGVAPAEYAGTA